MWCFTFLIWGKYPYKKFLGRCCEGREYVLNEFDQAKCGVMIGSAMGFMKFNNLYGDRHFMRAIVFMTAGKIDVVAGYGDVGKECASALKQAGTQMTMIRLGGSSSQFRDTSSRSTANPWPTPLLNTFANPGSRSQHLSSMASILQGTS